MGFVSGAPSPASSDWKLVVGLTVGLGGAAVIAAVVAAWIWGHRLQRDKEEGGSNQCVDGGDSKKDKFSATFSRMTRSFNPLSNSSRSLAQQETPLAASAAEAVLASKVTVASSPAAQSMLEETDEVTAAGTGSGSGFRSVLRAIRALKSGDDPAAKSSSGSGSGSGSGPTEATLTAAYAFAMEAAQALDEKGEGALAKPIGPPVQDGSSTPSESGQMPVTGVTAMTGGSEASRMPWERNTLNRAVHALAIVVDQQVRSLGWSAQHFEMGSIIMEGRMLVEQHTRIPVVWIPVVWIPAVASVGGQ